MLVVILYVVLWEGLFFYDVNVDVNVDANVDANVDG